MYIALITVSTCSFAVTIDTDRSISIIVDYSNDFGPIANADFELFKVADINTRGDIVGTNEFKDYDFKNYRESDELLEETTYDVYNYIVQNNIHPINTGMTNNNGRLTLNSYNGVKLIPGLYLLIGGIVNCNGVYYVPEPTLVQVPYDLSYPNYSIRLEIKGVVHETWISDYGVVKVWKEDTLEIRPSDITISLTMDGVVIDTVTLNETNNWRHIWKDLDTRHNYYVNEQTTPNYKSEVTREGNLFIVTNTYNNPDKPSDNKDKFEQTGIIWDKYIVAYLIGLVFIIAGRKLRNGKSR